LTRDHESAWTVFPVVPLRPGQVAAALVQAGSLETIDRESSLLVRLATAAEAGNFLERYGDTGEDEFAGGHVTIPRRLLMMNGEAVRKRTEPGLASAVSRIAAQAPSDRSAVEAAYLAVLTRRPTTEEAAHFEAELSRVGRQERQRRIEDLYWALLNSSEFSCNH
jgi:hypothetical protein